MTEPKSFESRFLALIQRMMDLQFHRGPMRQMGVTFPQFGLLKLVGMAPGSHLQDLASETGLTAPTISVGMRKLIEAGLVERKPDPEDKRATRLFLTKEGEGLHQKVREYRIKQVQRFLQGLSEVEQEQLLTLLEKAIEAYGRSAEAETEL